MPSKSRLQQTIYWLQKIEDSILIILLLVMISMAGLQIVLRNIFSTGILWGDGLVRVLVLWIGLMGAMIASRNHHHISIDVISRYLPAPVKRLSDLLIAVFTTLICAVMTYYSTFFVLLEKEDQMTAFASVPAWVCESIIPIAFGIISFRYLILTVQTFIKLVRPPA